jgi:hypothetical protein
LVAWRVCGCETDFIEVNQLFCIQILEYLRRFIRRERPNFWPDNFICIVIIRFSAQEFRFSNSWPKSKRQYQNNWTGVAFLDPKAKNSIAVLTLNDL